MNRSILLSYTTETRTPPKNIRLEDQYLFCHEYTKFIDPCVSILFDNVYILGGSFLSCRHGFIDSLFPGSAVPRRLRSRILDIPSIAFPVLAIESAIYPSSTFGIGYFHWISDYLPIIQAASDNVHSCQTLILPERAKLFEFVDASLRGFDFNLHFTGRSKPLKVNNLHVIGPVAQSGNYRSDLFRRALTTVKKSLKPPPITRFGQGEVLFISRRDAPRRFLLNEDEITKVINVFGGRVVMTDGMSLQEQYLLFANCKLLIGLHGAGLTNMIWMHAGSSVLEIRNHGDFGNNCYFSMASALGHEYYYVQAEHNGDSTNTYSANLVLHPEKLRQVINEIA